MKVDARHLGKQESRKRWSELRDLWNEFDPIGVMNDPTWPRNEYENYCGPCMRLLEQNSDTSKLIAYILSAHDHMGLQGNSEDIHDFATKMQSWFQKNWANTYA